MPLPGGPADKVGNRYEKQWGIWALLLILQGDHDAVTIEKPGETWAEFNTEHHGLLTWYQVKLKGPTASGTLRSILSILRNFKEKLNSGDDRCVLIPGTGNAALEELTQRAKSSNDFSEFKDKFLSSKTQADAFAYLTEEAWNVSQQKSYSWLERVEVWTQDEDHTKERNMLLAERLFVDKPATAVSVLGTIYEEQIYQTIDLPKLLKLLAEHNIKPKQNVGQSPKATWRISALAESKDILTDLIIIAKFANYYVTMDTDTSDWKSLALTVESPASEYADSINAVRVLIDCFENDLPNVAFTQARAAIEQVLDLENKIDSRVNEIDSQWRAVKELADGHKYLVEQSTPPDDVDEAYRSSPQYRSMRRIAANRDALIKQQDALMEINRRFSNLKTLIAVR